MRVGGDHYSFGTSGTKMTAQAPRIATSTRLNIRRALLYFGIARDRAVTPPKEQPCSSERQDAGLTQGRSYHPDKIVVPHRHPEYACIDSGPVDLKKAGGNADSQANRPITNARTRQYPAFNVTGWSGGVVALPFRRLIHWFEICSTVGNTTSACTWPSHKRHNCRSQSFSQRNTYSSSFKYYYISYS
jgi:hypothetical protein